MLEYVITFVNEIVKDREPRGCLGNRFLDFNELIIRTTLCKIN